MICTVAIEGIAAGGDGVAHLDDGMVVFVPRSAPGDTVSVEVTGRKARFARGRITTVIAAGPGRVAPTCPHYDVDDCGGCQLQHLDAESQRDAKRKIVGDALRKIAKLAVADPVIVASPLQWRYRCKVTLAHKGGQIGFRPYDRPGDAFDLHDCLLAQERVMGLWAAVRRCRANLPAALQSLVLRLDRSGGRHVVAIGGDSPWDAGPLAAAVGDEYTSFWWQPEGGAARVVAGAETGYPAVAFEQMNTDLAETIRHAAVGWFRDLDGKVAWDLYGGVGDTAEILAKCGARVWSVDVDRSAVEWGRKRSVRTGCAGASITRIVDRVEECLVRLPRPDLVVVNPPRSGLASALAEWLRCWGERGSGARMAYVSCDAATLARDLARMPSFAVSKLVAYDLFPQTAHTETLTFLEAA